MKIIDMAEFPKITFGIIVLNGEPFTRYCLRSIYPFAHEIIVVEGGHEDARSVCTPDGHSIDGTLETLYKFKKEEDPENKLIIITRNGFWPKKDELGRDRTPQSRAYAEKATGDYLWQIDIDEFYKKEDMERVVSILKNNPSITAISFIQKSFWGDIHYISDSWFLRRGARSCHRIFKWGEGYRYITHEPPTVIDENNKDLRQKKWVNARSTKRKKIYMYHYSLLFPWQVEQKVKIYKDEKPQYFAEMVNWASENYFKITNPYRIHNVYTYPSWLVRYKGTHPEQISLMMKDIKEGNIVVRLRQNEDVEQLLSSHRYLIGRFFIKNFEPFDLFFRRLFFNIMRVKNIPNRIKKMKRKYFSQ